MIRFPVPALIRQSWLTTHKSWDGFSIIQSRSLSSPAMRRFLARTKKAAALSEGPSGLGGAREHATNEGPSVDPVVASSAAFQASTDLTSLSFKEMDVKSLMTLAALEVAGAHAEILKRHIMSVDGVAYDEAKTKFERIAIHNRKADKLHAVPFLAGMTASLTAAFASFPLCFHESSVKYFNHHYVTADIPDPRDLETALEVGSWAWNWMEPPLGQISFVLLCLQFARSQMQNLGIKPYTAKIKELRAQSLVKEFPQYNAAILTSYSNSVNLF
eukprot:CAMPEP_0183301856 /NCGR_PEP_ID=MMETSP0160_2-20130417/7842_1 /TAXON_ID=2839 ORGANISM="Odontella Sinensis, Strain Grunow 1884" /NCGR_SAMPLE_ID=MMETSP0160_2 /ASSEMBLY_ACC=CAM_ASM_000250 /LENGTH=272 /DNA_ID=CAMNT_0025464549 /DNA_START=89 /DNA_END=907 /DNA_ORIENTATION=-